MSPVVNIGTRKGRDESQENAPPNIIQANHVLRWVILVVYYPIAKIVHFKLQEMTIIREDVLRTTHRPFIHPTPVVMFTFSSIVKPAI